MKRRDLVRRLEEGGFSFHGHGTRHDVYKRNSETEEIPRHREIDERLARAILKRRGLL